MKVKEKHPLTVLVKVMFLIVLMFYNGIMPMGICARSRVRILLCCFMWNVVVLWLPGSVNGALTIVRWLEGVLSSARGRGCAFSTAVQPAFFGLISLVGPQHCDQIQATTRTLTTSYTQTNNTYLLE